MKPFWKLICKLVAVYIAILSQSSCGSLYMLYDNNTKTLAAEKENQQNLLTMFLFQPMSTSPWHATGSMATPRVSHTATLLPNGKVLVAGGTESGNFSEAISSAEIYDPATETWSPAGNMTVARNSHTAALLENGKVIVIGGQNSSGDISSAELYDPATNSWTTTGSMAVTRYSPTSTLLSNGKVLVAGGYITVASELYDPATGSWSATGTYSIERDRGTMTLLANGNVLMVGGNYNLAAELYDSGTGTWSQTGSISTAKSELKSVLLPNGKVLAVGGRCPCGSPVFGTSELFDPNTGLWILTGSMVMARYGHTLSVLHNGNVLVAGGSPSDGSGGSYSIISSEIYNPSSGTWQAIDGYMIASLREDHTATVLQDGKVLVTGGYGIDSSISNQSMTLKTAELYYPE